MQDLDYSQHYEKWHPDTPEHISGMKAFYQKILIPHLPTDRNIKILDVGCGQGLALLSLQDIGYSDLVGIDLNFVQVQVCLKRRLNVIQTENSLEYLQKFPEAYHLILLLDVLEHIPYQEQLAFLRAIYRTLKPGGQIICTVPNANSILASRWRYIDWTHQISFTETSLDFLLYNAGFQQTKIHETEFFDPPNLRLFLSRSILQHWFWKTLIHYLIFLWTRANHRLTMIAELGWEQGSQIPLSLNLLAIAQKTP